MLGIPEEAGQIEVRRQILERLRSKDYVLPLAEREAVCLLLGVRIAGQGSAAGNPAARGIWQRRLREEFDAYCGIFWELSRSERSRVWNELAGLCSRAPRLRSHLLSLRHALDYELPELTGETLAVRALGQLLGDLCVLPPPQRALLRRSRLELSPDARREWRLAADFLSQVHPRLAQLDGGHCVRELKALPVVRRRVQSGSQAVGFDPNDLFPGVTRFRKDFQQAHPSLATVLEFPVKMLLFLALLAIGLGMAWLLQDVKEFTSSPRGRRGRPRPPVHTQARPPVTPVPIVKPPDKPQGFEAE